MAPIEGEFDLEIVPQDFHDELVEVLGVTDVNVESAVFNDRWRVRAKDHRRAHAVLAPHVIERLLDPVLEGYRIYVGGGYVTVCSIGEMTPRRHPKFAWAVADLAAAIPVLRD